MASLNDILSALQNGVTAINKIKFASAQIFVQTPPPPVTVNGYGINILDHGGDAGGVTDNAAALAAAYAAVGTTGGRIYFPQGKYHFSSSVTLTFPATNALFSLTLCGDGADASILAFASGFGLTIQYNSTSTSTNNQSSHVCDLAITALGTNVGTGLTLTQLHNNNGAFTALSDLTRVVFRGDDGYGVTNAWATCLAVVGVSNINCSDVEFTGPSARNGGGVTYNGINGSNVATVFNFSDCTFNLLNIGFNYGDNIQGMSFVGCNFTSCVTGINIAAGLSGIGSQLSVVNCQFGIFSTGNAISIQTVLNALLVTNNLFLQNVANTGGINLVASSGTNIANNIFICPVLAAGTTGINIAAAAANTGVVVSGNLFAGFDGAGSLPINVASTARDVVLANNGLILCNEISNLGNPGTAFTSLINSVSGNYGFLIANKHGATGDHGISVAAGHSGATADTGTALINFANGDNTTSVGSITRNGATGISLNTVNNIAGTSMAIDSVLTLDGNDSTLLTMTNTISGSFGFKIQNNHGSPGDHGIVIPTGATITTDNATVILSFATGNNTATVGSVTRAGTFVDFNGNSVPPSDARLKNVLGKSSVGLDTLLAIEIVDFVWKADEEKKINHGIIAQDLHRIFPYAVRVGGDDPQEKPWGVVDGHLTPLLIRAVQELAARVEELEKGRERQ